MTSLVRWALLFLSALLLPATADARWDVNGTSICGVFPAGCGPYDFQMIPDGSGGAYLAWADSRSYGVTDDDVYVQRVTAEGEIAPGWPATGLPVCVIPRTQRLTDLAPDGLGGVLIVWYDMRTSGTTFIDVYAQRIRGDGTIAPGWTENGVPATRGPQDQGATFAWIVPDGAGGAYVAWEDGREFLPTNVYAQHLTATGTVAPGWAPDGNRVCGVRSLPAAMIPAGAGGVIVLWADARRGSYLVGDTYAQRLRADGSKQWEENGRLVVPERVPAFGWLVPDNAGGFYVGSRRIENLFDAVYTVQRFGFDGERAAGWPAEGVTVCAAAGDKDNLKGAMDGQGGIVVAWYDYRSPLGGSDVYASRVLPNGALAPGYPPDGLLVSDPGEGLEFVTSVAGDGAGGTYLAMEVYGAYFSSLMHLAPDGTKFPGWPTYGHLLSGPGAEFDPQLVPDGVGGVIVAWMEADLSRNRAGLYARRFDVDGPFALPMGLRLVPRTLALRSAGRWVTGHLEPELPHAAAAVDIGSIRLNGTVEVDPAAPVTIGDSDDDGVPELAVRFARAAVAQSLGSSGEVRVTGLVAGEPFRGRDTVTLVTEAAASADVEDQGHSNGLTPRFALHGASPNPARGALYVSFTLPAPDPSRLELYDVSGRLIESREVGRLGAGTHRVVFAARDLPAGLYLLRLTDGTTSLVTRVAIAR